MKNILETPNLSTLDGVTEFLGQINKAYYGANPYKEKTCRFGHICTSSCGNDKECPCQVSHCCALTKDCEGCDDHYEK